MASSCAISTSLIDIDELSHRLSVAKGTLYNWVYLRRIPFIKAGRCLRFDYQEVLETLHQYPIIDTSASLASDQKWCRPGDREGTAWPFVSDSDDALCSHQPRRKKRAVGLIAGNGAGSLSDGNRLE